MGFRCRTHRVIVALGLGSVILLTPLTVSAAQAHAKATRPAAGSWTLVKSTSAGIVRDLTLKVTKGGKRVKDFSFIPTGSCAGKRITVSGSQPIKRSKKYGYYVGDSYTSTALVNVTQGGAVTQAGLLIRFSTNRSAVVAALNAIGTTGGCDFNPSIHKAKK